jgi:pimeloyl-ACP methyl ester carboxylesterase
MRSYHSLAIVLGLFASACSVDVTEEKKKDPVPTNEPTPPTPAPAGPTSKLAPTACRFIVPRSIEGKSFHCADLAVPESRAGSAREVKIHVIVFHGKQGGTPTIELHGGPGGTSEQLVGALAIGDPMVKENFARFIEQGDYVVFDQRGTGRSIPRLSCLNDKGATMMEVMTACRDRLTKTGIDLAAYNTAENADDVHDLKLALGAAQVNLHGISYGTRLALEVLRRHPGDVRAAIIDGVAPPDRGLISETLEAYETVLATTFGACAADAKCNATYPNLDKSFTALKAKLDATPFKSKFVNEDGTETEVPLGWPEFVGMLRQDLYVEGAAASLPFTVRDYLEKTQAQFAADEKKREEAAAAREAERQKWIDTNPLAKELSDRVNVEVQAGPDAVEAANLADGMHLSVVCSDWVQHESLEDALARMAKVRPEIRDEAMLRDYFTICASWPKKNDASVFKPVTSDRPTLVIGGALDPATPLAWARHAAKSLSNSQLVEIADGAHGLVDTCGMQMKLDFLATGLAGLDTSCAKKHVLAFYYPDAPKQGFAKSATPFQHDMVSAAIDPRSPIAEPDVPAVSQSMTADIFRHARR